MTIGSLQKALQHLIEHEGASRHTEVVFYLDEDLLQNPSAYGQPGPGAGRLVSVNYNDQLDGGSVVLEREPDR